MASSRSSKESMSPLKHSTCQSWRSRSKTGSCPATSKSHMLESQWSCKLCTFLNTADKWICEMCGTRDLRMDELDPVAEDEGKEASIFWPLRSCKRGFQESVSDEASENRAQKLMKKDPVLSEEAGKSLKAMKILSYNVWFNEDLELHKRMEAIGQLIQQHSPDVICLQEVTPQIFEIFQKSSWWGMYSCSLSSKVASLRPYFCMQLSKMHVKSFLSHPFKNSIMGRELCIADIDIDSSRKFLVATTHLESPCPAPPTWDQMFSKERVIQAKEAVDFLNASPNVILAGDMNWDEKHDGPFPLPGGWIDAWAELRSGENGWTYDTKANKMLSANRTLQKRLDRFLCKLEDFQVHDVKMIGQEAISGATHIKEKRIGKEIKKLKLPVLPSDHYGLLLTISRKCMSE